MPEYISLRAYARRRGVRLSAVQKAIESRRVTAIREEGGRITGIDPIEADAQWAANTDPVEAARNGKLPGQALEPQPQLTPGAASPAASGTGGDKPTEPNQGGGDQGDYLKARATREGFLAKQAELEYLEQIGRLVSAADVEREFAEIFSQLKSGVYQSAESKSQILAAETDAARIALLQRAWLDKVFDEHSRRFATDAAGGTPEREAALP